MTKYEFDEVQCQSKENIVKYKQVFIWLSKDNTVREILKDTREKLQPYEKCEYLCIRSHEKTQTATKEDRWYTR